MILYDPETLKIVKQNSSTELIHVPDHRLDTLLSETNIHKIDYLSIDVERAELAILKELDFSKIKIHAISVENNRDTSELRVFLQEAGFRHRARLGVDDMFVNARTDAG